MTDERYWRVPEVAERLRVDPETVRRWLRAGKLRGMLLSQQGGYRIPESEVRRFIAERFARDETEENRVAA
ncbi:MAG: helix-turn-helix domain-containing protein [Chloroflexota bacterium]|nr:helix-turn-helix domain-containing protein [Chloroflexota bacterium]